MKKQLFIMALLSSQFMAASAFVEQLPHAASGAIFALIGYKVGQKMVKGAEEAFIAYNVAIIAKKIGRMPKEIWNKLIPGRKNVETLSELTSDCGDSIKAIEGALDRMDHDKDVWVSYLCGIIAGALGWYYFPRVTEFGHDMINKKE
jgi:hypothetical protein